MKRPRPIVATNRWLRTWWPLFVSAAAVAMVITMAWVALIALDQRHKLDDQNEQLVALVERQRAADAARPARLTEAVASVEVLMADYFARHDENVALKLNDTLTRIAALLGRPAGIPVDPVTAEGLDGATTAQPAPPPSPERAPGPTANATPPPTTTTTTPDQRSCTKRPDGPRC